MTCNAVRAVTDVFIHSGGSEALKGLLRNPHLRRLVMSVDSAEDKAKAMKDAMQEPLFVEFADQCLNIIEPTETEKDFDDEEFWSDWTVTYGPIPNASHLYKNVDAMYNTPMSQRKFTQKWTFADSVLQAIEDVDEFVSSSDLEKCSITWMLCSEWVPSEWVHTADKSSQ